jgi:hypothetical protein
VIPAGPSPCAAAAPADAVSDAREEVEEEGEGRAEAGVRADPPLVPA